MKLKTDGLLPCVVFVFSRANTQLMATALDAKVDLTTGEEKGIIKKFLK
jgi:superfamily II RNA helicase